MSTTAQATTAQVRQAMVSNCLWGVQHEPDIHYLETRPMPIGIAVHHLPFTTDCSGFATLMAKWSGAGDPNGSGFDGQGFTGTMLDHCEHITAAETQPGDFVVFGPGGGEHVVILIESAAKGLVRRWLVYTVPGLLGVGIIGAAWCLFDRPWHQCWHDKAAHTFVAG
ncbi:hypothetical protein ABZ372_16025 [Streptomyces sp. NPDC005921]